MAEQKKGGFGALEDRIHELEEERKRQAPPGEGRPESARAEEDEQRERAPERKK